MTDEEFARNWRFPEETEDQPYLHCGQCSENYMNGGQCHVAGKYQRLPRVEEIVLMERALDKQLPHPDPANPPDPRMTVAEAAEIMRISQDLLRKGIRQKVFPWAYAVEPSPHHFVYIINARRFMEAET